MITEKPDWRIGDKVIYRNNQFIAVNKPAAVATQPDQTDDLSLLALTERYTRAPLFLTHRIDRPASGVVLFAKTKRALQAINQQFKDRTIRKKYLAIVGNHPPEASGILHNQLIKNSKTNKTSTVNEENEKGVAAELRYQVIAKSEKYVLLEIDLITGRHHQIRAQLGAIGSPIRGDVKYGFKRGNKDRSIQLHAWKLSFIHPVSNEEVHIEAPLPADPLWDYFKPFCENPILPPTQSKD
ncbi:MAG: RluA family pseudouridine synthase [Bacteroidetes bacterium]|nr:RluA family pseudouridine synthase [Bacteroidota bacterium]